MVTLLCVWILAIAHGGPLAMLGATFFGSLVALMISWRLARGLLAFRLTWDVQRWRQYLVLGLPMAGSQILRLAILRGDSLILSLLQPAAAVGLYGVSTKIFELATSLAFMFGGLMMPSLSSAFDRDRAEFSRVLGHTVDTAVIFGVGCVLALAPFAPQVLSLIAGPEFADGAPALIVISFAIGLAGLSHVLRFALMAYDRPRLILEADAAACVIGFVAYFALIPKFSLLGAATGTVIAEACSLVGMLRGLRRAGVPLPSPVNLFKAVGAGGLGFAGIMACNQLEVPWPLTLVLAGVIYLLLLALTRAIPPELISSVLRRRDPYQRSA